MAESKVIAQKRLEPLHKEAEELIAILVTIVKAVKMKGRLKTR
jgi:hypothetical protein